MPFPGPVTATQLSYTIFVMDEQPSKIIAVHLSYRSRAMERGRLPLWPSYFLKPPKHPRGRRRPGAPPAVVRAPGVRGRGRAHHRHQGEPGVRRGRLGARALGDRGQRLRRLRPAARRQRVQRPVQGHRRVYPPRAGAARRPRDRPGADSLRTWVNGELAQDAVSGDDLLFSFADIVADISRLTTLEPGDVVLTGTPTGSTVVRPVTWSRSRLTRGRDGRARPGCPPGGCARRSRRPTTTCPRPARCRRGRRPARGRLRRQCAPRGRPAPGRAAGVRSPGSAPPPWRPAAQARLQLVTLDRLHATSPSGKMAGFARTLRYVPFREDLFARYGGTLRGGGLNAQKRAVEQIRPGEVLVIEARGDPTAGTVGDILALRAQVRGAAGIVTDGAIRDSQALQAMDLPVYYGATHPAVLGRRHVPWEVNTVDRVRRRHGHAGRHHRRRRRRGHRHPRAPGHGGRPGRRRAGTAGGVRGQDGGQGRVGRRALPPGQALAGAYESWLERANENRPTRGPTRLRTRGQERRPRHEVPQ
jgi:hypothetical protein